MASPEREQWDSKSKDNTAHVEDASPASNNGSTEKKDLGALEAQTPEAKNEVG